MERNDPQSVPSTEASAPRARPPSPVVKCRKCGGQLDVDSVCQVTPSMTSASVQQHIVRCSNSPCPSFRLFSAADCPAPSHGKAARKHSLRGVFLDRAQSSLG